MVDQQYMEAIEGARRDLVALVQSKNCAPIFLRLAFHDAANFNAADKTGGVNGSLRLQEELGQPPNGGIKVGIDLIEEVKKKHPTVSYADLYQLAGVVAVGASGGPAIFFVPGRKDTDVADTLNIPNPNGGADHLRTVFHQMGLVDKDIVTLSGAHTLGRAHSNISGFDGPFTREPLKFDNSYYVELLKGDTEGLVKFPTDKVLLQDDVFRPLVEIYAKHQDAFFRDYAESHKKMSELGFTPKFPNPTTGGGCHSHARHCC
uniref:L-ascorbate peroxidase n=1 Tax=Mesembryanthemum crystallinum TaxID=3544 RepID=Q42909_MESCR|nr:ascorbate peroxidase [Mesembryanthemum crystallinum]